MGAKRQLDFRLLASRRLIFGAEGAPAAFLAGFWLGASRDDAAGQPAAMLGLTQHARRR